MRARCVLGVFVVKRLCRLCDAYTLVGPLFRLAVHTWQAPQVHQSHNHGGIACAAHQAHLVAQVEDQDGTHAICGTVWCHSRCDLALAFGLATLPDIQSLWWACQLAWRAPQQEES